MARKTTAIRKPRRDIEAEVTEKIIAALEKGTVPWAKPWTTDGILPTSVSTGRPYRGINVWLLTLEQMAKGYESPYWLTFNQAQERGGSVRKGEKGTLVVFWKRWDVDDPQPGDADHRKSVMVLRHYVVFNLEQCDDVTLPPRFTIEREEFDPDVTADDLIRNYAGRSHLTVKHAAQDAAYYSPSEDTITLPTLAQFRTAPAYYGVAFHELTHSTGHATRLDRFEKSGEPNHFGSELYAKEELVAAMGSSLLRALCGIESVMEDYRDASYVANWLERLRNDKSLVVRAAAQAQRAADLVTGTTFEKEEAA
jgi:antirestriction protein ArdC